MNVNEEKFIGHAQNSGDDTAIRVILEARHGVHRREWKATLESNPGIWDVGATIGKAKIAFVRLATSMGLPDDINRYQFEGDNEDLRRVLKIVSGFQNDTSNPGVFEVVDDDSYIAGTIEGYRMACNDIKSAIRTILDGQ